MIGGGGGSMYVCVFVEGCVEWGGGVMGCVCVCVYGHVCECECVCVGGGM